MLFAWTDIFRVVLLLFFENYFEHEQAQIKGIKICLSFTISEIKTQGSEHKKENQ